MAVALERGDQIVKVAKRIAGAPKPLDGVFRLSGAQPSRPPAHLDPHRARGIGRGNQASQGEADQQDEANQADQTERTLDIPSFIGCHGDPFEVGGNLPAWMGKFPDQIVKALQHLRRLNDLRVRTAR